MVADAAHDATRPASGQQIALRVEIGFSIGNDARLSGHSDTGMIAA
jgi:hypothetical protein